MSTNRAPVESGLQVTSTEFVEETTPGDFPSDPEWNAYSPELSDFNISTDGNKEARQILGQIDPTDHDRATESATVTIEYRQARFPVDPDGNVVDPIAYPIVIDADQDYPSHTVVQRREVNTGGKLGAGYREIAVVSGARPVGASFDGDPSATEPIPQELSYEAERARVHTVHQPPSEETLVVRSTDASDANDVVIESEDASTTETVTLPGADPNTVVTTESFGDIDAIEVQGEHAGDIQVGTDDGTGAIDTELLEKPLTGTNTDGVDSIAGVPALGSGSHADPISEEGPQFLGTMLTWSPFEVTDDDTQVNTLTLDVEREVDRRPRQTTRRETIDVGPRTTSVDADFSGPHKSADLITEYHRDEEGDLVWVFDTGQTITLKNAVLVDAPDFTRSAGDTSYVPSVSVEPHGSPAITISNN